MISVRAHSSKTPKSLATLSDPLFSWRKTPTLYLSSTWADSENWSEVKSKLVAPHFAYIRVLLASPNPHPVGVLVGGGVSIDVQDEVENVVKAHQAAGHYDLIFVRMPVGFRERVGAAEADQWFRDVLGKAFGVVC